MPGDKYKNIKRPAKYEALRRKGLPKTTAAKIANSSGKGRKGKK